MPRRKGAPKTGGRQRGTPNKVTRAVRDVCLALVEDEGYIRAFTTAFRTRKLPPAIELTVWAYAYGKPPTNVHLGGLDELAAALREDLAAHEGHRDT
ncbi:MAG TPA: hypothetical protein VFV95_01995 [Vicinamibacterales bacterium]|nr:hypothetical protein [Vicinamibacterales bacterium]